MRLSQRLLIRVPEGLPTDHAALTEPMAVGLHAVRKAQLSGEEVPLVVGCGPVGLAVIAALKLARVGPVIAADFSPKRRQLALDMGADTVVDPGTDSPYSHWADVATVDERGRGLPLAERSRVRGQVQAVKNSGSGTATVQQPTRANGWRGELLLADHYAGETVMDVTVSASCVGTASTSQARLSCVHSAGSDVCKMGRIEVFNNHITRPGSPAAGAWGTVW